MALGLLHDLPPMGEFSVGLLSLNGKMKMSHVTTSRNFRWSDVEQLTCFQRPAAVMCLAR